MAKQLQLDLATQLVVDLFAGAGGVSVAMEMAWGRSPDIAINHNADAISVHQRNHPQTKHYISDVFEVCPLQATEGRTVGWLHLSPDCTHFSQASAGQPRDKKIRALSWVGYRWAAQTRPIVASLENVAAIMTWGKLIAKRDPDTGRVLKRSMVPGKKGKMVPGWLVAEKGERVKLQDQFLVPDPKHKGKTWKKFIRMFESLGYVVEFKMIRAADMGGHTTRERLIMLARCDGQPIQWGEIQYAKDPAKNKGAKLRKWKPAHEAIDFSRPCPSIFSRKRPLAPNTMKRIAKGIDKFVLNAADPFIVPIAHYNKSVQAQSIREPLRTIMGATKGGEFALAVPTVVAATHHGADRVYDIREPAPTVTGANRGELMLSTPVLAKFRFDSGGTSLNDPMPTITAGGKSAREAGAAHALGLVSPLLVQAAHGEGREGGVKRWGEGSRDIREPIGTVTGSGSGGHAIAAATLVGTGGPTYAGKPTSLEAPMGTILKESHKGLATAYLMQANDGFNTTFGRDLSEPMTTITNSGSQQQLVCAHVATLRNNCDASSMNEPISTVAANGQHQAVVESTLVHDQDEDPDAYGGLSPEQKDGALKVAAFLLEFYSTGGQFSSLDAPMNTLSTKDRMALVTVHLQGVPYVIVDIGLRMLEPRELFNAQDFPPDYVIHEGHDGRKISKSKQVKMVGNSVDPYLLLDAFKLNAPFLAVKKAA